MPNSELYDLYAYYNKSQTDFEKKLAAERLSEYFEKSRASLVPSDRVKAAAVADILGRCNFQLNNPTDTEFYFLESIRIYRTLGLDLNAAQAAVQLAMFYLTRDRQQEAQDMLEYYEKQQLRHFGEGHFRHVNASEMRVIVTQKRSAPAQLAIPLSVA